MKRQDLDNYFINIPPLIEPYRRKEAQTYLQFIKTLPFKQDLRCREEVCCKACEGSITVYRHTPRTNQSDPYRLSARFSTYHPQDLQQCGCGEVQALVDHHGRTRIYTRDPNLVHIKFPILGFYEGYATQSLGLCKTTPFLPISNNLLPSKEWVSKTEEDFRKVSFLNLWPFTKDAQDHLFPSPEHPEESMQFYIDYAYTHRITLMVTWRNQRIFIFQNGHWAAPHDTSIFEDLLLFKVKAWRVEELVQKAKELYALPYLRKGSVLKSSLYPKLLGPFLLTSRRMTLRAGRKVNPMSYAILRKILKMQELLLHQPKQQRWYTFRDSHHLKLKHCDINHATIDAVMRPRYYPQFTRPY